MEGPVNQIHSPHLHAGAPGIFFFFFWFLRSFQMLKRERASFANPYIASPTPQLILQPFRRFTYVTARSTTLPLLHLRHTLHLRHSSFSNPSAASSTSQLIVQPFRRFPYVTANSPTLPPLHLRHSSFFNPFAASPTSQLILQPFRRFTCVTAHSPTLSPLPLRQGHSTTLPLFQRRHRHFTYFTWRTAHA